MTQIPFGLCLPHVFSTQGIVVVWSCVAVCGQGTIQTGFEEYATGTRPPFVSENYPNSRSPAVADTSSYIPPFEGQKFLWVNGSILIESPNGQPIQSASLRLFIDPPVVGSQLQFNITGKGNFVPQLGVWQSFEANFSGPVQRIEISAFYRIGERFTHNYAIDSIKFVTVPEPRTTWLLVLSFGTIVFYQKLRRPARRFTPAECEPS